MDKVFIEGLEADTVIGIHDWERKIRQTLRFDIELGFDNRVPAATDRVVDTLDYDAISQAVTAYVQAAEFELVETLAERCVAMVMQEFGVRWMRLKLAKPGAVRNAVAVGVIIERGHAG